MSPLQQSEGYASALQTLGTQTCRLDGQLTIRRSLPLIGPVHYVPRGGLPHSLPAGPMIFNAPDETADTTHAAAGHFPILTPQTLAVLDLRPDDDARMAAQHVKWRNRLRRAQGLGLQIASSRLDPVRHHWLLTKETEQRGIRGYQALPHAFTLAYPAGETLVLTALQGGMHVAAMLILLHRQGATYHIGWSGPEGRQLNAHALLMWRASQRLRALGCTHLDLGALDTRAAPGLARFKLGTGATPYRLGHTWLRLPGISPVRARLRTGVPFPLAF